MDKDDIKDSTRVLEELGGESLEGSGFEHENPDPGSEWRDPR